MKEIKPFDIILEARIILDKRIKTLLIFFGLNMVCLSVSFTNKPHLWFWFLVVGCYLVYEWQKKQKDFQSAKILKFDSVSELEKDLNMEEVTNDEWENIKKLNEKLKMFFNVENVSIIFFISELSYCWDARYSLSYRKSWSFKMNYPNLPNSALEITEQPEVKEITNELLKQLQNALKSNALFTDQVELSLKGIVRILEVLLSLDFFKNANEIDSSLRNSIEWLTNAGESLKLKMKEYERFFNDFNTSMRTNEQEVTATLNANTENIKSEVKKLENQIIETTTRLLTSYQIFLNQARDNANHQITENKTQSLEAITLAKTTANNEISNNQTQAINNINEAKENATTQINTNKQEVLNHITQEKNQATSEIIEAKKTDHYQNIDFFEIE